MIPIDQKSQIRRRNSLLASYSSSSSSSTSNTYTPINTTNTSNNNIMRRRMSLPGSLRPLKKRRVVSIQDFQDDININAALTLTKSTMNNIIMNVNSDVVMTTATKKNVSWNDLNGNMIHSQDYHNHVFNERDIWYTREEYDEFSLDRVRTIECLRGMKRSKDNNIMDSGAAYYCIRGLEPFHDRNTSKQYHSKKKLYHSTVIIEQVRQGMLGIKEPERFRFLVSPQSDLAILRAQELASQDEKDVYPYRSSSSLFNYDDSRTSEDDNNGSQHQHHHQQHQKQSRRSSMSALIALQRQRRSSIIMNSNTGAGAGGISNAYYNNIENSSSFDSSTSTTARRNSTNVTTATDSSSDMNTATKLNTPSLFTDSIRRFQEKNARRLVGIYAHSNGEGVQQQSCSNSTYSSDKMANEGHNLFRYSVRRNSLLGMLGGANNADAITTTTATMVPTFTSSFGGQQQQTMQHQQQPVMETLPTCGSSNGVGGIGNNNNNDIDNVINSHRRQHHKQLIEETMMAMRTTRFPIRRDTLSHLQQTHNHHHNNNQISGYHHHSDNDVFPIPTDAFVFSQNARKGNSNDTTDNGQQNFMKYSTTVAQ